MNKPVAQGHLEDHDIRMFLNGIQVVAEKVNETARRKGFWDVHPNVGEKIALIHSEASEALEALRKPTPEHSKKIPDFLEVEDELADIMIRVMDFAVQYSLRLPEAIIAKLEYNDTRPPKHGKNF